MKNHNTISNVTAAIAMRDNHARHKHFAATHAEHARARQLLNRQVHHCLELSMDLLRRFQQFAVDHPDLYGGWTPVTSGQCVAVEHIEVATERDAFRIFYRLSNADGEVIHAHGKPKSRVLLVPFELLRAPTKYAARRAKYIGKRKQASETTQKVKAKPSDEDIRLQRVQELSDNIEAKLTLVTNMVRHLRTLTK